MPSSRAVFSLVAIAMLSLAATSARATPITWTLEGLDFSGGGGMTGSFVFDATTGTYSDVDITVAGPSLVTLVFDIAQGFSGPVSLNAVTSMFGDGSGQPGISILFAAPLSDLGGIVSVLSYTRGACFATTLPCDTIVSTGMFSGTGGTVSGVPAPATLPLMGAGILATGLLARRRKRRTTA